MAIRSPGLSAPAHVPTIYLLHRFQRGRGYIDILTDETGNRWVHAESALTHFNEFPFRGLLYRKFPARFPRKLSRSRRVDDSDGDFLLWELLPLTSGKLYFPRSCVPRLPREKHREANLSLEHGIKSKFWFTLHYVYVRSS